MKKVEIFSRTELYSDDLNDALESLQDQVNEFCKGKNVIEITHSIIVPSKIDIVFVVVYEE